MVNQDPNKQYREMQRRTLNRAGWKAVPALKTNGAFTWRWIIAGRKLAYEREEAYRIARRQLERQ